MTKRWIRSEYGVIINLDLITCIYIKIYGKNEWGIVCRHVSTDPENIDETCLYTYFTSEEAEKRLSELFEELQKND